MGQELALPSGRDLLCTQWQLKSLMEAVYLSLSKTLLAPSTFDLNVWLGLQRDFPKTGDIPAVDMFLWNHTIAGPAPSGQLPVFPSSLAAGAKACGLISTSQMTSHSLKQGPGTGPRNGKYKFGFSVPTWWWQQAG